MNLELFHKVHRQQASVRIGAQHYLGTYSSLDALPRRFGQLSRIVIVDLPRHHQAAAGGTHGAAIDT